MATMAKSSGRFLLWLKKHHGQYFRNFSEEASSMAETKKQKVSNYLFDRLLRSGKKPKSVCDVAEKMCKEGKKVEKWEIERLIRALRNRKRFDQALQLSEWMQAKGMPLTADDHAVRVKLIGSSQGVESAEKYYNSLPGDDKKETAICGALLNCFCRDKMVKKAESFLKKMKEEGILLDTFSYNNLMSMYVSTKQANRALALAEEMKSENVPLNKVTYNVLMNIYAALNDIEGMAKVLEDIEGNDELKPDWTTYSNLASLYIKVSMFDKAEAALKEMEKINESINRREVFHYLLSLYASTGNLSEVKRVWEALRSAFPKSVSASYFVMLSSLVKLNDISGARELFDEWESSCTNYDFRVANIMIKAYLNHDMLKDAESVYDGAVKKGGKPNVVAMESFIDYYSGKSDCKEALRYFEKALCIARQRDWKARAHNVQLLQKCVEENGDVDTAKDLYEKLNTVNLVDVDAYNSLLRTYAAAKETDPLLRGRIEADNIQVNSETENLLEKVCPS